MEVATAAATASPTSHHRALPTAAAPAPSSTLSLRPHQVPPPPPSEIPVGFVPRVVALVPDPPRRQLRSVVVGGPCLSAASEVDEVPETQLDPDVEMVSELLPGGQGSRPAALRTGSAITPRPSSPCSASIQDGLSLKVPLRGASVPGSPADLAPLSPAGARRIEEPEDRDGPWQTVQRRRSQLHPPPPVHSRPPPTSYLPRPRPRIPRHLQGLCFKCYQKGHFVVDCRDPVCCRLCKRSGHKERNCPQNPAARPPARPARPAPPSRPFNLDSAEFPPLRQQQRAAFPPLRQQQQTASSPLRQQHQAMARRPGDPRSRPAEASVVVPASMAMQQSAASLSSSVLLLSLGGSRPRVSTAAIVDALHDELEIPKRFLTVVRHYPEDFLVDFTHQHHRELAMARPSFRRGILDIHLKPWSLEAQADHVDMRFHVLLELEGVKLHAWDIDTVTRAIGDECDLDYILARSVLREDATTLGVWVWTDNPDLIPKVKRLKLPARTAPASAPSVGRRALRTRVLVHLAMYEDFTGVEMVPGVPAKPRRTEVFDWELGVIDGERPPAAARAEPRDLARAPRRDDEDGDRDGRGRAPGRGWRDAIRRSLSRSAGSRDRDGDRRGDGRVRDRSGDNRDGGRRRHGTAPQLVGRAQGAPGRGRTPSRSCSPGASRRRSAAARTPPSSPVEPSSPTSVLPVSGRSVSQVALLLQGSSTPLHVSLSSPAGLTRDASSRRRSVSPVSPPGFEGARASALLSEAPGTDALFVRAQEPLLPDPVRSPRPSPPANRRKTFAVGFTTRRSSARIQKTHRGAPVAKMAERNLLRKLGIIDDNDTVTKEAIDEFVKLFREKLPPYAISALRALFRLDCDHAKAVEEALIRAGGQGALELEGQGEATPA